MRGYSRRAGKYLCATAVIALATGLGSCSIVPDWADPTTWFGSDKPASSDAASTPDLANLPDKPKASQDKLKVTDSLAADRAHAEYSATTLRGGTEAAAPPPPELPATGAAPIAMPAPAQTSASKEENAAPAQVNKAEGVDRSVTPDPSGEAMPGTLPDVGAPKPQTTSRAAASLHHAAEATRRHHVRTAAVPAPAVKRTAKKASPTRSAQVHAVQPVRVAKAARPVRKLPILSSSSSDATEASDVPPGPVIARAVSPSDAELGFKPSAAPPLDPSVAAFVPARIVRHYRATAPVAAGGFSRPVAGKKYARKGPQAFPRTLSRTPGVDVNLSVLRSARKTPGYANPAGLSAETVVYFPGDIVSLNNAGRSLVREAADQYKSRGGEGFVRIVGHASSRTSDMPVPRHLEIIFQKSQARANAVAQALIRAGVPADKILVEAVGDSQPIYYESMPKGEEGNRRAEIFFQS